MINYLLVTTLEIMQTILISIVLYVAFEMIYNKTKTMNRDKLTELYKKYELTFKDDVFKHQH